MGGGPVQSARQREAAVAAAAAIALQSKTCAPPVIQKKKKGEKSPPSSDDEEPFSSGPPPKPKMELKQGPIPVKQSRREIELEELLADEERKKEADKTMLWRKLQAELAKSTYFASE